MRVNWRRLLKKNLPADLLNHVDTTGSRTIVAVAFS